MSKQPTTPKSPTVSHDSQAEQEAERAELALENVRKGYGEAQKDHTAGTPSGAGSEVDGRDGTSDKRSGQQ